MVGRVIVLDTGPVGLITNPKLSDQSVACNQWLQSHLEAGSRVTLPEISDYEVRRELLRANKKKGCSNWMDYLNSSNIYRSQQVLFVERLNFGRKRDKKDSRQQGIKQLMAT